MIFRSIFSKKILSLSWLLVFTLLSMILSGCGKAGSTDKAQIEIMVPAGYYQDYVGKELVPKFNKIYPDIKVIVSSGDTILDTRLAAGDAPDIYASTFGYMPVKYAKMGRLVDYRIFPDYDDLRNRILPRFEGKVLNGIYYVPWNLTTQLMIYNKELFKQAGLDPDKPPETCDDFLKYAAKIQQLPPRKGVKIYGTGFMNPALSLGGWYWSMLAPMYYTINGGKYQLLNEQGTMIDFNKPEAKMAEYLNFMKNAQNYASLDMSKGFFSRTMGMWLQFGYGWMANFAEAADYPMVVGKDIGLAPMPVPKKGDTPYSTLDGRALILFRTTPERIKNSWLLVKFLMEDENNLAVCKALGQLPSLKSLQNNPFFHTPESEPFIKQLEYALPNESSPESDVIQTIVLQMYAKTVVLKQMDINTAIADAARQAIAILKADQE